MEKQTRDEVLAEIVDNYYIRLASCGENGDINSKRLEAVLKITDGGWGVTFLVSTSEGTFEIDSIAAAARKYADAC